MTNSAVIELLEEGLRKIPARNEPCDQDLRSRFAAGFGPLLQGMLLLAHIDGSEEYLRAVSVPGESSDFPSYPESTRMVVLSNPPIRGHGPIARTLFAPDGKLGLRAVTFHESGEVGLLLPQWVRASSKDMNTSAYTVATIRMDGYAKAHLYSPEHSESSGSIDSMVGFPRAGDVLADALPKLGAYFEELSQVL